MSRCQAIDITDDFWAMENGENGREDLHKGPFKIGYDGCGVTNGTNGVDTP